MTAAIGPLLLAGEQKGNEGMPRRPARVTQSDIARALRAAKEAGAKEVIVDSDGVIRIVLTQYLAAAPSLKKLADGEWMPSEALQNYVRSTETT